MVSGMRWMFLFLKLSHVINPFPIETMQDGSVDTMLINVVRCRFLVRQDGLNLNTRKCTRDVDKYYLNRPMYSLKLEQNCKPGLVSEQAML